MHRLRLFSAGLLVLGLPLGTVPAQADHPTPWVLAQAEKVFDREIDPAAAPPDATPVLRRLARSLDQLEGEDRDAAVRMLARPTSPDGDLLGVKYTVPSEHHCGPRVCIHFVRSTADAPPDAETEVPAQVQLTSDVFEQVWTTLVDRAGYRAPLPDDGSRNAGPDGRLDVYLADIGSIGAGYYGFCNSDDPRATQRAHPQVSGYCVLDDDFSTAQFDGDPLTSLQVTAAHEFFHAVQFAYDYWEDLWFMEGTAAWAEELVFDEANDNHRYLGGSQLSQPWLPLDRTSGYGVYGSWIFWQFLTEHLGVGGADPTVVREVWERAIGRTTSLQALTGALAARGSSLKSAYARFGTVNLDPVSFYEEGSQFSVRVPLTRRLSLSRSHPQRQLRAFLDHLTTDYYRFRAAPDLVGRRRLKVRVDMPGRRTRPAATLVIRRASGELVARPIKLAADGTGQAGVSFTRTQVRAVYLVLTNAGAADGLESRVKATVLDVSR